MGCCSGCPDLLLPLPAAMEQGGFRTPGDPDYDRIFTAARKLNPNWHTITLNVTRDANGPVTVVVDTGTGRQPQKRTSYVLNRDTGSVVKMSTFADGSLGQRLRAFVRFGHTGEYGGWPGQIIAAFASLGRACSCTPVCHLRSEGLQERSRAKRFSFQIAKTTPPV